MRKVRVRSSAKSFGDVSWAGRRGITNLIAEPDITSDDWSFHDLVDSEFQLIRELPAGQLLVVAGTARATSKCSREAIHFSEHIA
jgi:hypothetical protein